MKTIEFFSGTASFSKVAKSRGHETLTIDNNPKCKPDILENISFEISEKIFLWLASCDIVWLSPPCQTLSMASGNKHWTRDRKPKTPEAIETIRLFKVCERIAQYCEATGKIYFIENPRARARWLLPIENRFTVWYCQYNDNRAKPTDIWTNLKNWIPKTCHNNNKYCHHQPAPRGSKTGTQGLKKEFRGVIPPQLFNELFDIIENNELLDIL